MNRRHDDEPILITGAARSSDEEFAARKKRYTIIMACRIPCLLLAGVFGITFNLPLVAVLFIVLSVPLPWVAVLIANDRTPHQAGKVNKYQHRARRLENNDRKLIEAAEVLDARDARAPRSHEGRVFDAEPPTGSNATAEAGRRESERSSESGGPDSAPRRAG